MARSPYRKQCIALARVSANKALARYRAIDASAFLPDVHAAIEDLRQTPWTDAGRYAKEALEVIADVPHALLSLMPSGIIGMNATKTILKTTNASHCTTKTISTSSVRLTARTERQF